MPRHTSLAGEPERLLLDQIAQGVLDPYLTAIAQAIRARYKLLQTVNSAKALAQLTVGDAVCINHHARPRYLQGPARQGHRARPGKRHYLPAPARRAFHQRSGALPAADSRQAERGSLTPKRETIRS